MNYDLYETRKSETTLRLGANSIGSIKASDITRTNLRRFEDGKIFSSSRLGQASRNVLLEETRKWAGPGIEHHYGFAKPVTESRDGIEVSQDVLMDFEESVADLVRRFPKFVFSGNCSIERRQVSLQSDYGVELNSRGDVCHWILWYQRKGSGSILDGLISQSSTFPAIKRNLEQHEEFLDAQKNEVSLKAGRMPVIFYEPLMPLEKLNESLLVHLYCEGACLFAGRMGEPLFSPKLTLLDRAYMPEFGQIEFFDGEGVVRTTDDLVLIENGRIVNLMADLRFGHKFLRSSSGNGVRDAIGGVRLRARQLCLAKGEVPWRKVVSHLDRCLVVFVATGGDTNDLGEFSTPVQIGYVFEKGRLIGRAPQLTVKSSITDYLGKNLVEICSDGVNAFSPSASVVSEMEIFLND